MKKPSFILFCVALISSCGISGQKIKDGPKLYFDVPSFIQTQIAELKNKPLKLEKIILLNGESETKEFNQCDSAEMSTFTEIGLNKAAYEGKFSVDTTLTPDKNEITVRYVATDDAVEIRECQVVFDNGAVQSIAAVIQQDNRLYHSTKYLRFAQHTYSIEVHQKTLFFSENTYRIEVAWTVPDSL